MQDLISRQAAIDAAIEATKKWDGLYPQGLNCEIQEAVNALPSAQPEQRWISATERLPEPAREDQVRGWYLVTNNYNAVTIVCYEFERSVFRTGWQTDLEVVAWMHLPEPYKPKEEP